MKPFTIAVSLALGLGLSWRAAALTYAGPNEVFLTADVDGDGRLDAVVVDVATGAYRIGYQLTTGSFTWAPARASGVQNVTSVAAGRMLATTNDALAFTGPTANRINVLGAADPSSDGPIATVFPGGVAPAFLVSLNFAFTPVTPQDDLVCSSLGSTDSGGGSVESLYVSGGGGVFTELVSGPHPNWVSADRVQLVKGGTNYAGAVEAGPSGLGFHVYQYGPAGVSPVVGDNQPVLPIFVYGQFATGGSSQFLFYNPGDSRLILRRVQGPSGGNFTLGTTVTFDLGVNVGLLFVVDGAPPRLLLVSNDGSEAMLYDFDGVNAPALRQTLTAAAGQTFTGAIPFGGGSFHLLGGPAGAVSSTQFQQYGFNGTSFVQTASGALPSFSAEGLGANVFYFPKNPFTSPGSLMLGELNAADWTDSATLGPSTLVQAERYASTGVGLAGPTARNLGAPPAGTGYALVNQYAPSISLVSFDPGAGAAGSDVQISPPPGLQSSAAKIVIKPANPTFASVFYSLDGGPWTAYSGPFWLFKTTVVQFFAQTATGSIKSALQTAFYSFSGSPATADSNGDGVPDYVAIAYGVDPTAGTSLNPNAGAGGLKGLSGLNAVLEAAHSGATNFLESFESFDLAAALYAIDPGSLAPVDVAAGAPGAVHTLDGGLLETALAGLIPGFGSRPSLLFTNLRAGLDPGLVVLSTDPNLDIDNTNRDHHVGRQMLGIVPVPAVTPPVVDHTYGGGALAVEAANWLAAAVASYEATPRVRAETTLSIGDTLAALVFERAVNELLFDRGASGLTETNLTLFGFRPADAGLQKPVLADLRSLAASTSTSPAYDLRGILKVITDRVITARPPDPWVKLENLLLQIYAISGLSNNLAPGLYPSPPDAFRAFLLTGELTGAYASAVGISAADLNDAYVSVNTLLRGIYRSPRPVSELDLTVEADSFSLPGCTKLVVNETGVEASLFVGPGRPYQFPSSFQLPAGSIVHVTAFTDFTDPSACTATALQVTSASLVSTPTVAGGIMRPGRLLPDAWSNFFFGGPVDPFGDADGDGRSNLQEYLDGTDPRHADSHGAKTVVLNPPALRIQTTGGEVAILFPFPGAYSPAFRFEAEVADRLDGPFVPAAGASTRQNGDWMEIRGLALPASAAFCRVAMSLK